MKHKIMTDYREDEMVEVAIDVTDSSLGSFEYSAYVLFHKDGSIEIPFSGDRRAVLNDDGLTIYDGGMDVIATYPHED